ncbi:hypothetical protein QQY66_06810 [Streptomyces sp. DG2A-72]|nr:hypothetical protein [Streptomyces sp. DG2A-72]MDO0931402.1 hypothetical protein [Streptomyces sp. DG2A-72]
MLHTSRQPPAARDGSGKSRQHFAQGPAGAGRTGDGGCRQARAAPQGDGQRPAQPQAQHFVAPHKMASAVAASRLGEVTGRQ